MKLIDLLNIIANKETVPDIKFKIGNKYKILHYVGDGKFEFDNCYMYLKTIIHESNNDLNKKIEIIEEDKEIKELSLNGKIIDYGSMSKWLDFASNNEQKICSAIDVIGIKINELIREVNKLKKEGK